MSEKEKEPTLEDMIRLMLKFNSLMIRLGLASDPEKMVVGSKMITEGFKLWMEGASLK